ncbi:hypothetical protein AKO1_002771 [Acrasis kona]|uniref:Uncharacterized protein n=1 Tax=Acrasis kona TaxID=1008807 RepID=A0AAW2YHT5_9EUKA
MGLLHESNKSESEIAKKVIATEISAVPVVETTKVIQKEAIISNVVDKPVLEEVIEKKNVEVHHVNVVQEIHEQPIIEVEKTHEERHIQEKTELHNVIEETKFETINTIETELTEPERKKIKLAHDGLLSKDVSVKVSQDVKVDTVQDAELVREIIIQPIVEHHQQALVTEVHEKKVVEVHEHPIVRKIVEKPIVREIETDIVVKKVV